jgi:hypothetical protein
MQLQTFLKNNRRLARLTLRGERINSLTARAEAAKNTAQVEAFAKEKTRRAAEVNYLATRIAADLEDHPQWAGPAKEITESVLAGSRSSAKTKAILAAAVAAGSAPGSTAEEAEAAVE